MDYNVVLWIVMFPTPKKDCIRFNNAKSLLCNTITKVGFTLQPNLLAERLTIEIVKEQKGFSFRKNE